jgi:hypothetical protein
MLLCSVRTSGPSTSDHQPIRGMACSGSASARAAHRLVLIERSSVSTCFPYRFFRISGGLLQFRRQSCYARGSSRPNSPLPVKPRQAGLHGGGAERARHAKRARKRPTPLSQFEAGKTRMEISTPTGQPCLMVGHEIAPDHHQAKQAGLGGALPAANACTNWRQQGSRGHSTASLPAGKADGKCRYCAGSGAGGSGAGSVG